MAKKKVERKNDKLMVARNLPPSYHKLPDQDYSVKNSEVIQWLIQRPSILEFVWDQIKNSDDVKYDPETGKWQGVDWEDEDYDD